MPRSEHRPAPPSRRNVLAVIYHQLTAGVGAWGAFKPLLAAIIAIIPFFYLGQHFNRQHKKARDWTLFQIPLLLTLILFPPLYVWSIFDAYQTAVLNISEKHAR